jgi:hypothetical protein
MTQSPADPQPPRPEAALDVRATMWEMITAYRISQIVRTPATLSLAEHCAAGTVTAASIVPAESTTRPWGATVAVGQAALRPRRRGPRPDASGRHR